MMSNLAGNVALRSAPGRFEWQFKGAHRDFSTSSRTAQFHAQVKLQIRRFTLVKLQRSTFAASMQKQLPKLFH